jgi:hypothetical protein
MKHLRSVLTLGVLHLICGAAQAACYCACVNGNVRPICQNETELPPLCSPTLCPLRPPSLTPLNPPHLLPLGTTQCRPKQVFDPNLGRYVWRKVCE